VAANKHSVARVLCLDDEPQGLAVRQAILEQSGYIVRAATSGDEALRFLATEHFDLVISDHLLKATTGTRVAILMKLLHPGIPILILSGLTEAPEGMEFADGYLCKLDPPPVFLATVAKLLHGSLEAAAGGGK
jgi:CheY-like chemotaxis protein